MVILILRLNQGQQRSFSWMACYEEFILTNTQSKGKHTVLIDLTKN